MKSLAECIPAARVRASKIPLESQASAWVQSTSDVVPGCVFFALRGARFDGHAYVADAVARGALAVVVETREAYESCPRAVWVDSTRRAYAEAVAHCAGRPTQTFDLVGVTGTNGKTTVSFLLRELWRKQGKHTGLVGTVQNEIGAEVLPSELTTPDAALLQGLFGRMQSVGTERVAMEVSSIALDQWRVAGSCFRVAVFTNFTPDHLDYHGSMAAYFDAKKRLFDQMQPQACVLNADDPASESLRKACSSQAIGFGVRASGCEIGVQHASFSPEGVRAVLRTPQGEVQLETPLLGEHNLSNCLAVLATQHALGDDLAESALLLKQAQGAPGRLERVAAAPGRPYVFVDYAHTEDALRRVLECLRQVRGDRAGRLITVFGCGGDRDKGKRPRMGQVAEALSDSVVVTSDNPRTEDPQAIVDGIRAGLLAPERAVFELDRERAIRRALELAGAGDFVLVAGKGHENYQVLGARKVPFDDRRVVREYYR